MRKVLELLVGAPELGFRSPVGFAFDDLFVDLDEDEKPPASACACGIDEFDRSNAAIAQAEQDAAEAAMAGSIGRSHPHGRALRPFADMTLEFPFRQFASAQLHRASGLPCYNDDLVAFGRSSRRDRCDDLHKHQQKRHSAARRLAIAAATAASAARN